MIATHGGDVVKFAGDSLIIAFAPTDAERSISDDSGRKLATLRSARCASQLSINYGDSPFTAITSQG